MPVTTDTGTKTTDTTTDTVDTTDTPTAGACTLERDPNDDAWIPLAFSDYPELIAVGGSAYVELGGEPLILARVAEDCVVAMDRLCTHAGCEINYKTGRFSCPCHGSTWDDKGVILAGPARNQPVFPAVVEDDMIWLRIA